MTRAATGNRLSTLSRRWAGRQTPISRSRWTAKWVTVWWSGCLLKNLEGSNGSSMNINQTTEENLLNAVQNNRLSHTYMFEGDTLETLRRYSLFFALNIFGDTPRNRALLEEGNHPDFYYLS